MGEERVLQVVGPSIGGMARHARFLTQTLGTRGWSVELMMPTPSRSAPTALAVARRAVARAGQRADVIHAHGLKAGWVAASIPRSKRPPVVVTVHNLVLDVVSGRWAPALRVLQTRLGRRADAVIAVSREVAAHVGGQVIWPAAPWPLPQRSREEVRAGLGIADDSPLLVAVGRLHPQKGYPILIDALRLVAEHHPRARAVIVGEGPMRKELTERIARAGLSAMVTLAGESPNAGDELAAADAVVIPSLWESGPLVLMEAMALGRPVISTAVGFAPELVLERVTGRLVAPGDARVLGAAIAELLADPAGAARLAQRGQLRVFERFDPSALVSEVEQVYRSLIAR